VSLGRAFVALGAATCGLAVVAVFAFSYAVSVVATLLAGLTGFAAFGCGTFYVATAFFGLDRDLARDRRRVLAYVTAVCAVSLLALSVFAIFEALANSG